MEVQICTGPVDLGPLELLMKTHVGSQEETPADVFRPGDTAIVKVSNVQAEVLPVQLLLVDASKKTVASSAVVELRRAQSSCADVPLVLLTAAGDDSTRENWGSVRLAWSWREGRCADSKTQEREKEQGHDTTPRQRAGDWRNSKQLYSHTASSTHWLPSPQAIRTAVEKSCASRPDGGNKKDEEPRHPSHDKISDAANIYQFPIKFVAPKDPSCSTPRAESARASRNKAAQTPQGVSSVVKRLYPQQEQPRIEKDDAASGRDESRSLAVVDSGKGGALTNKNSKTSSSSSPRQRPPTGGKPPSDRLYPRTKADPHEEIAKLQRRMEELQADRRKVESMSQRTHALESLFT